MEVGEGSDEKSDILTGWLRMWILRMNLRRTKSAIISLAGSNLLLLLSVTSMIDFDIFITTALAIFLSTHLKFCFVICAIYIILRLVKSSELNLCLLFSEFKLHQRLGVKNRRSELSRLIFERSFECSTSTMLMLTSER